MIETVEGYLVDGCMRCKFGGTSDCKVNLWRPVLVTLRDLVLKTELSEEVKWGVPCYTDGGKNILMLGAFKEYACISFLKGSLIEDPDARLIKQGANTQTGRIIKYYKASEVKKDQALLLNFIQQAIEIERSGRKPESSSAVQEIPTALLTAFEKDLLFKEAFYRLSPSKRRGYIITISQAKQLSTQMSRVEKIRVEITKDA